jgi:hypothetical protein
VGFFVGFDWWLCMKSAQSPSRDRQWTIAAILSIAAGLVLIFGVGNRFLELIVTIHFVGLLCCLLGARLLLRSVKYWDRILSCGFICGVIHGAWGFLFILFPPDGIPPNYIRGVEGGGIVFVMCGVFTGVCATFASAIIEVITSLFCARD